MKNKKEKASRAGKPVAKPMKYGSSEAALAVVRAYQASHAPIIARDNQCRADASLGRGAALTAKARAAEIGALPRWADLNAITAVYAEAARKGLVVDHVIPLRGKKVCGLHVLENLALITDSENRRKGNNFPVA